MSPITPPLSFNPAGIELDRRLGLTRQLYDALRQRVLDGRLVSGTRLPATRDLAAALSISRNSVVRAYDQLYAEGFIESRVGDGTYVAQLPTPKKLSTKVSTGFSTGLSPALSTKCPDLPEDLDHEVIHSTSLARVKTNHLSQPPSGPPRAFRVGVPAFDLFPFEVWAKLNGAFWRKPDLEQLCYGDPAGDARLRGLIAAYLRSSRGMQCAAEQIVITCGAQQAISLCAQFAHGLLAVLHRVADVAAGRADDAGITPREGLHHSACLVDAERGLGEVGQWGFGGEGQGVDLRDGLDEGDGRIDLPLDTNDFGMPWLANQDQLVTLGRVLAPMVMHFADQWAGCIEDLQLTVTGLVFHFACDAVGAENRHGAERHGVEFVDKQGALVLQLLDYLPIVDDFMAHIDRSSEQLQSALDGIDCPHDTCAKAPGLGEEYVHGHALA